jgi:hypothetical protein
MRGVLSLVDKRQKNDPKAILMVCVTGTVGANIHALFIIHKFFIIFYFTDKQMFSIFEC